MCWPQPAQVTFPQVSHIAGEHIFVSLLFSKQTSKEARLFGVILVALALLRLGDAPHHVVNVLATARPSWFAALAAGYFLTHLLHHFHRGQLGRILDAARIDEFAGEPGIFHLLDCLTGTVA